MRIMIVTDVRNLKTESFTPSLPAGGIHGRPTETRKDSGSTGSERRGLQIPVFEGLRLPEPNIFLMAEGGSVQV